MSYGKWEVTVPQAAGFLGLQLTVGLAILTGTGA